jgi:hypothetical protein
MLPGNEGIVGALHTQNVNTDLITISYQKRYKNTTEMTKAHFVEDETGGDILISRGPKLDKIISNIFTDQAARYRNSITATLGEVLDD